MPRYAIPFLLLASPVSVFAWPQIFDKASATAESIEAVGSTTASSAAASSTGLYPISNSTASNATSFDASTIDSSQVLGSRQLPYTVIKTVPSAKFRAREVEEPARVHNVALTGEYEKRGLPVVDPEGTLTVTLPVSSRGLPVVDTNGTLKTTLPVSVTHARGLPVIPDDFNTTLPVAQLEGLTKHTRRGLPVVGSDPDSLYKIALPAAMKRGLPVVDSDPDSLYKITLPVAISKRGEMVEMELPVTFVERDEIEEDDEELSVTIPVVLDTRGLPVVTDDPDSLYKITLPVSLSSGSRKRDLSLSSTPSLQLSVPLSSRGLPVIDSDPDSLSKITLPVSISARDRTVLRPPTAEENVPMKHYEGRDRTVLRPPTDEENVPMKHYEGRDRTVLRPPTAEENVPMKHYQGRDRTVLRPPTAEENVPMKHYARDANPGTVYGQPIRRSPQGMLKMPIVQAEKRGLTSRSGQEIERALENLSKRDGEVIEMSVANRSDVSYYVLLDFGSPAQSIYVQIDTGSFELWINPDCDSDTLSSGDKTFCEAVGSYDPSSSSTSAGPIGTANLKYGIGAANVSYYTDNIAVSSASTLSGVQFGVASATEDQFSGIMGLGYGNGDTISYKNFVDELADQNITSTRLFSLGLGAKTNTEGVLLFGGVDKSKFEGPLTKLPIIPADDSPDGVPRYWVQMENITITPPSGQESDAYNGTNIPTFLDSGATLTLLPPAVAAEIALDFGATNVSSNGFYSVDCETAKANGTINFAFEGLQVQVPYKEMVRTLATDPPTCWLGIIPSTEFTLLGDTFLRSVYAVFDIENDAAWLAPYSNCGEDLMSVSNGTNLATVTGACTIAAATMEFPASSDLATMTATQSTLPAAVLINSTPTSSSTTTSSATVETTAVATATTAAATEGATSGAAASTTTAAATTTKVSVTAASVSAVQTAGSPLLRVPGCLMAVVVFLSFL